MKHSITIVYDDDEDMTEVVVSASFKKLDALMQADALRDARHNVCGLYDKAVLKLQKSWRKP